ncbi:MAG: hypothetical protein JJT89_17340 [Nitriliruptoraceae bacterium]|nr:hypothetical protein [Nitriliruptoraceae bacterium]
MRGSGPMRFAALALVVAACTGGQGPVEPGDAAGAEATPDPADEDPDGERAAPSEPLGPGAGPFATTVTPLELDLDVLAGTDVVEEAFAPSAIDVVGTRFHVFGERSTAAGTSLPAVYRSPLEDGRSWDPIDLALPDDVVGGSAELVDAADVTLLRLRGEDGRSRVELRQRTADPRLITTIEDGDLAGVRNVAVDGDGYLAVGIRVEGGRQYPAAWSVQGGEARRIELPQDPALAAEFVGLDAAVVQDGTVRIAGHRSDTEELFWLEGPSVDELAVVAVPDGLEDVHRLSSMLPLHEVLWVAGAATDPPFGRQSVWSRTSSGSVFDDRTEEIYDGASSIGSTATRLVSGNWGDGRSYVHVAAGGPTRWWTVEGARITEVGQFGGVLAAHSPVHQDSVVTFDDWSGAWSVGFQEAEVSLAAPLTSQERPTIASAGAEAMTLNVGANETARTVVVDPGTGDVVGELAGRLDLDAWSGSGILTGWEARSAVLPAAARLVDGALRAIDLDVDEEWDTSRAVGVVTDGEESLIVGHRHLDGGMVPMAWTLDGAEATRTDRFDGALEGRGLSEPCGPTTAGSTDARSRRGVTWPFAPQGPVDVLIDEELGPRLMGSCVEAPDGTVWVAGIEILLALAADGSVEQHTLPELYAPAGLDLVEVDGAWHLVALVSDRETVAGLRLWTAPLDDPSSGAVSERLEIPATSGRPRVQGFDRTSTTYTVSVEAGTTTRLVELALIAS